MIKFILCQLIVIATAIAQDCSTCEGSGRTDCNRRDHDMARVCGMTEDHKCSLRFRTDCCRGLGWLPCLDCKPADASKMHRNALAERRDWVREASTVDVKVGARYAHVETEHFLIHSCVPEWRFDRIGKRDRDQAAHLFALRLEKLAARFKEIVGRMPEKRSRIFLQWDMEQELKATQEFGPFAARTALRGFVGKDVAWFGYPAFESLYRDQGLQSHLVHNASHLLVEGLFDFQLAPPWLSAGVAHFFEQDAYAGKKDCTNFCSERVSYKSKWASGSSWAKLLSKESGRGKGLGLLELAALKAEDMGAREHAYAFAWTGFFLLQEAAQRDAVLDALIARQPASDLPGLLQLDETSFKKKWRAHLARLR